jgi:hypothetical protein
VRGVAAANNVSSQRVAIATRLMLTGHHALVRELVRVQSAHGRAILAMRRLVWAVVIAVLAGSLAVTGSVNQHGDVQAVGGVNEKIEGWFRLCRDRGLDGAQAVIVPTANRDDLMLDRAVREAARAGLFHVLAVASIDEAISLLTGQPAGRRDAAGIFPRDSVNGRIEARLARLAERDRSFGGASARGRRAHRAGHARND